MDLDKSGHGFQRVRTYLGPSLGWIDELVQPTIEITNGGVYDVKPGDSLILVDVGAAVTINLPDVIKWMQQPGYQPATGFDRSITVKDLGGNAGAFNIVIAPFGQQAIDNIQQAVLMTVARATVKFVPLIDLSGWAVYSAGPGGGGGAPGGGDVFKAGNNTFTASNDFSPGHITVRTMPDADSSTTAASTEYVKSQNYITGEALLPYALIESPTFTGTPKAPTPAPSADDQTIVTVGFVETALAAFSGGAPVNAEYVVGAVNPALPASRTFENTGSVTWDLSTPGKVRATTAAGGGNVSTSGVITVGQLAQWATTTSVKSSTPAAAGVQPLDGDLTALAALTGTNTIYYRSATDIWSPVAFSGLSFSGGVLTATAAGGDVFQAGTNVFTGSNSFTGATITVSTQAAGDNSTNAASTAFVKSQNYITTAALAPYALLASPTFTGDPKAPTPAPGDNDTSIATTAFVAAALSGSSAGAVISATPPGSPTAGMFWYDLSTGILSVYVNDGNTTQWVQVSPVPSNPNAAVGFSTGDAKLTYKTVADAGWVLFVNDGSIGDASSGATNRANADTSALFSLLWANIPALIVQDSTGTTVARGGSAAADFSAHRRLAIPASAARAIGIAGVGSGLTARTLGGTLGAETVTPTVTSMPSHAHGFGGLQNITFYQAAANWDAAPSNPVSGLSASSTTTDNNGSNGTLAIMNPTTYMNVMVKL
jgi:hypothetical protein